MSWKSCEQFAFRGGGEYAKTRTEKAHLAHDVCRCSGSPAAGCLNGSSSLEESFTKRIDFRTNFLAAVTLSTSMKHLKVENNHRGAFRIRARTPPKGRGVHPVPGPAPEPRTRTVCSPAGSCFNTPCAGKPQEDGARILVEG